MKTFQVLLFLFVILVGKVTTAQNEIKLLSWNIYMLPSKTMSMHSNMKRAREIADQFITRDYDVICVQEMFDARVRKYLCKSLKKKYPYQVGYDDQSNWIRTNSGLYVFSKYPLKKKAEIIFNECEISDCFADKGALVAELNINGELITIFNTHLQAGREESQEAIRLSQLKEIKVLHDSIGSPENVIYCGDFNICVREFYNRMIDILEVNPVIWSSSTHSYPSGDYAKKENEKIFLDYVLTDINSNLKKTIQVIDIEGEWSRRFKKRHSLSDHRAVRAEISW